MASEIDWVDGWEIHSRPDGGYGVYDSHGLLAGPFGSKAEAIAAALKLPKAGHPSAAVKQPTLRSHVPEWK